MDLFTKILELDLQLLKAEASAGLMDGLPIDFDKKIQ